MDLVHQANSAGRPRRIDSNARREMIAAVDTVTSVRAMASALNSLQPHRINSTWWQRKVANDELQKLARTLTPYGTVCQEVDVNGTSGDTLSIYYASPFSLLYEGTKRSALFSRFLAQVMSSSPGGLHICFYLDRAKPGSNTQRPDIARTHQCIYWSVLQFPSWFRSRRCGWIPFAYVEANSQIQVGVSDSMLVRFLCQVFDPPNAEPCFSRGFGVVGPDGTVVVCRCSRYLSVADWEQHVKTFNLKGYNGSVPCGWCQNLLGRCPYFDNDPMFVHIHSPEYDKLVKHTPATFAALADTVRDVAFSQPAQLATVEQSAGIKFDAHGLLWDSHARRCLQPPYGEYPDFMHTFVASGGLAQYELNGFVLKLADVNISPADIDTWCLDVSVPSGVTKLRRTFWQDRVVMRAGAHIRAFASEVLSAVTYLGFFIDAVFRDLADPSFQPYLDCFDLLRIILDLFTRGIASSIPTLRSAIHSHHILYMQLYHCIAKLHQPLHCVEMWEMWGALLSCFGPERHHRLMKRVMLNAYRHPAKSALAHDVRTWLHNLDNPDVFMEFHFVGKVQQCDFNLPGQVSINAMGSALQTPIGLFSKRDLVQFGDAPSIGFCLGFVRSNVQHLYCIIWRCIQMAGSPLWQRTDHDYALVPANALTCSLPYIERADGAIATLIRRDV